MTSAVIGISRIDSPWMPARLPVLIGKDIMELLSSSMYVDPMTIYREYVQNAVDSIEEAWRLGMLPDPSAGRVEIVIDNTTRTVRIRDNGTGISRDDFAPRMTAFGASFKRGTRARGFRGVGRLAGIGYCQDLIFRSRVSGETHVSELKWNGRKVKEILKSSHFNGQLHDVVAQCVETRQLNGVGWPEHFFEVELRQIVRHSNDSLLNYATVEDYLSQVSPVPFAPEFRFGKRIQDFLDSIVPLGNANITINGRASPIYRPHRNTLEIGSKTIDEFKEIQLIEIPALDGTPAASGWILHHSYQGAISPRSKIRGLRLRSGNIQVGESNILEELFPETRFNSWCVGEIHVIDQRIVPNGRRDHFEHNVHYHNLVNHLIPVARDIRERCRTSSMRRNWLREFVRHETAARDKLNLTVQGSLPAKQRTTLRYEVRDLLSKMEKIAARDSLREDSAGHLKATVRKIQRQLVRIEGKRHVSKPLAKLPPYKRRAYEQVFGVIYECVPDANSARSLIDRILSRLG